MPKDNEQGSDKYLFALSAVDISKVEEGKRRTFAGTAYAGGRVDGHWYWGRTGVVFDLQGIAAAAACGAVQGVADRLGCSAGVLARPCSLPLCPARFLPAKGLAPRHC